MFTGVGTYTIGAGQLRVYHNGVRQYNSDYTETSTTSFTLTTGAYVGDVIMAEVDAYTSYTITAADVTYSPTGQMPGSATTAQLAIDSLESRKAALAGATFTGCLLVSNTTVSTSTTSGAMQITGGAGFASNIYVGSSQGNSIVATGNIVAPQFNFANGVNILSTVGGTYSNANVVANLQNFVTSISTTANITTTANVISPNYLFANGVNILSTIAPSSTYSNSNVTAYLTQSTVIGSGSTTANLVAAATTTSTSTSTGALVVKGGAGIAGRLNVAGNLLLTGTDTPNPGTLNLGVLNIPNGGISIGSGGNFASGGAIYVGYSTVGFSAAFGATGNELNISAGYSDTQLYTTQTSQNIYINNGSGLSSGLKIAGTSSNVVIITSTASTSTTSGALVVKGGVGITGNANVGGVVSAAGINTLTYTNTTVTGSLSMDCSLYNTFVITVTGSTTLAPTNVPRGHYQMYVYCTYNGGSIGTYPATTKWPSNATPTQTGTTNKTDIFVFATVDGGTNWYATTVGQNY